MTILKCFGWRKYTKIAGSTVNWQNVFGNQFEYTDLISKKIIQKIDRSLHAKMFTATLLWGKSGNNLIVQ